MLPVRALEVPIQLQAIRSVAGLVERISMLLTGTTNLSTSPILRTELGPNMMGYLSKRKPRAPITACTPCLATPGLALTIQVCPMETAPPRAHNTTRYLVPRGPIGDSRNSI